MEIYKHRQWGTLILWALGLAAALILVLMAIAGPHPIALAVLVILFVCMFLSHALTVQVTTEEVTVWFGSGLIRRRFPVALIQEALVVRNRWYYGWGIRLMPRGWMMFNVSGLDAVELHLADGRRFRIGTDDPEGLVAAIGHAQQPSR